MTRSVLRKVPLMAMLLAGMVASACGGGSTGDPSPPPTTAPVISSFTATPTSITSGSSSTLSWSVSGASSLSIDQGVGTVTAASTSVSPSTTTTYTLTATNVGGSTTASATITVNAPPPVITSFTATPSNITTGSSSALSWSVTGATSLSVNQGIGTVTGTGTVVHPTTTTTYTLTATNPGGKVTANVTVTVNAVPPIIAAFTATPATISIGSSTTLAWNVAGATSLSLDQGVGTVTGTSTSVTPVATTTFTLTATNAVGGTTATATVTVNSTSLLEVACSGASCGAVNPSQYSGAGVGIWRYVNVTASPVTIDVGIGGVRAGLSATLLFSNGKATPTTLPAAGALASPQEIALLPAFPFDWDPAEQARDQAHANMLELNRDLALSLRSLPQADPAAAAGANITLQAPLPTPVVGDTRTWYDNSVRASPVAYAGVVAKVVCSIPGGRKAVFWVDPAATSAGNVSDADLAYFQATFCDTGGGYGAVTALRGDVWGTFASTYPTILIQDVGPALQDVHVVFLNVPSGTAWGGYFYSFNSFQKTYSPPNYAYSNETLAFFVNARGIKTSRGYYGSTLLHELTHMVNYYQRSLKKGAPYDTWLEEMSAMMTEDVITPAVTPDHYAKIPDNRIRPYIESGGAISLINWGTGVPLGNYALGGSLGAFLDRRHGLSVYTDMVDCATSLSSYACVDSLIQAAGGVGFGDEFARLGATVFGLLPVTGTPSGYGFPAATAGAYSLAAIDLSSYARPATAASLGSDFLATTHTYQVETVAVGKTTYIRTGVLVPPGAELLLVIR